MKYYAPKRRFYRKRKAAVKKAPYKRRSALISAPVKRYINKTIHRNIENKTEQTLSGNNTINSYAVNSSLFCISCIPYTAINQGVGGGDRIGNTIKTRRVFFNYVLRPSEYSATLNPQPQPQDVIIMFGKVKNSRPQQPINTDFAKLWQAGDSSHAPYSTGLDLIQDVNKDWFTVYKVLRHKVGYQYAATAGMSPTHEYYANNDYKFNVIRRLNITKYVPKTIKFNDSTAQPTNDGLWMWAFCVNADGGFSQTLSPILMDYTLNFDYEDA